LHFGHVLGENKKLAVARFEGKNEALQREIEPARFLKAPTHNRSPGWASRGEVCAPVAYGRAIANAQCERDGRQQLMNSTRFPRPADGQCQLSD
jgi:hypothetical protein